MYDDYSTLGLYFEAQLAGFDGEMFYYTVYLTEPNTEEKRREIDEALDAHFSQYAGKEGIYTGDYWTGEGDERRAEITLDLGNCRGPYGFDDEVVKGVLKALNNVTGIQKVIVNEGCDDYC